MSDANTSSSSAVLAEPLSAASATASKTILLLDGVQLFLKLETTLLQRREWRLLSARTAAEARTLLEREPVDLVLMDYVLPDATGDEMVRFIRENPATRSTGILIVTARGMRDHVDRCMAAGCNAFLFKPVTRTSLCQRVKELLDVPVRRHVRTLVRLQVKASCGDQYLFGNTVNLSAGGLLLETPVPLSLGEFIQIRFFLPGEEEAVTAEARVVRRESTGAKADDSYGLVFERVSPEDRERISAFVDATVKAEECEG